MGCVLYGRLWQYVFSAAKIEVVTIPVAEFMASVVGLLVLDHDGVLDFATRIWLEINAEATPRSALQGDAGAPGLLIAHDEFTTSLTCLSATARASRRAMCLVLVTRAPTKLADLATRRRSLLFASYVMSRAGSRCLPGLSTNAVSKRPGLLA